MNNPAQLFDDLRAALATAERALATACPLPPRPADDLELPTVEAFSEWRRGLGLSAAAAADLFGVSAATVRGWERMAAPNPFNRTAARLLHAVRRHPGLIEDLRQLAGR